MNQGGINNPALIGASQREARNKLDTMAGIQRPGGIMASSPQLMQAAMPARPPVMPARPPVMPQSPARMVGAPMAPPGMPAAPAIDSLPNIPMPTTVAPRSMDPMAAAPTTGQPVVQLAGGGEPFRPQFQGDVPASAVRLSDKPAGSVDLGLDSPEFMEAIKGLTEEGVNDALKLFGGPAGVVKRDRELENGLKDVMTGREATPAKIAAKTLELAGVPDTAEGRMDFAETLGFDTNDIGALDDKIMEVLMAGQSTDFQQAVLMGLQNYKSTAMARAAAKTGGSGYEPLPKYAEAIPDMIKNIMSSNPGTTIQEAAQQAASVLNPLYGRTAGGGAGAGGDEKRVTMYDPSGKPFYSTDGTNFVDADGNPYAPPATE